MQDFRTFPDQDWQQTPDSAKAAFLQLEKAYHELFDVHSDLQEKSGKQEIRIGRNSGNSDKPPSADNPYKKKLKKDAGAKNEGIPGGKKGHKGHRQQLMEPAYVENIPPEKCTCGNCHFPDTRPFYTHQEIEFPEIKMDVKHFILHMGQCPQCGKINKGTAAPEHRTGFGPGPAALIGDFAGSHNNSRTSVQEFCASVLNFHISPGAVQKVIDRCSESIRPHYEKIGEAVRKASVADIDETSFPKNGVPAWLRVMAASFASLFMIHPNRSKAAFYELIRDWEGILVSDGCGVYKKWAGLRQTCPARLIRAAKGLSERSDPEIAKFGRRAKDELKRLCGMGRDPPGAGQWNAFYAGLIRLITLHHDRDDDAGRSARRLKKELDHLWVFLKEEGAAPTNNHAERMLRSAVLWRKRSQGTASDKGERRAERLLTLRQTCRLNGKNTFSVMVDAIAAYFKDQEPDINWISDLK